MWPPAPYEPSVWCTPSTVQLQKVTAYRRRDEFLDFTAKVDLGTCIFGVNYLIILLSMLSALTWT
jgi:hypothetical protein